MGKRPDIAPPKKVKLVDLPSVLRANGISGIGYNAIYASALNGTIPAERTATGTRWVVDEAAIPQIIANFSLLRSDTYHVNSDSNDQNQVQDTLTQSPSGSGSKKAS